MPEPDDLLAGIEALEQKLQLARDSITRRFIGQERVVDLTLATLLCGGHGLLVGLPGLGKTRLVETLSTVMGLDGKRVQFTPDLMPADILGSEVLDTAADGTRAFRFLPGPVFCQLLMAAEINRASPRTQSALLQAMQERQVTVAGADRPLGQPFHVLATQNPIEQEGTYPLPEAQLDRFMLQIDVPYPTRDTERDILLATTGNSEDSAHAVFSAAELVAAQTLLRRMPVGDAVVELILDLVRAFRPSEPDVSEQVAQTVAWGPGPRAAQALMLAVRARALLHSRLAPNAEDVLDMALPVLSHRMQLSFAARARGDSLADLISETAADLNKSGIAACARPPPLRRPQMPPPDCAAPPKAPPAPCRRSWCRRSNWPGQCSAVTTGGGGPAWVMISGNIGRCNRATAAGWSITVDPRAGMCNLFVNANCRLPRRSISGLMRGPLCALPPRLHSRARSTAPA